VDEFTGNKNRPSLAILGKTGAGGGFGISLFSSDKILTKI